MTADSMMRRKFVFMPLLVLTVVTGWAVSCQPVTANR
jgi:hypothetical protein